MARRKLADCGNNVGVVFEREPARAAPNGPARGKAEEEEGWLRYRGGGPILPGLIAVRNRAGFSASRSYE